MNRRQRATVMDAVHALRRQADRYDAIATVDWQLIRSIAHSLERIVAENTEGPWV